MITLCLSHYEWLNCRSGIFALKTIVYLMMKMIHSYKGISQFKNIYIKKAQEEEEEMLQL